MFLETPVLRLSGIKSLVTPLFFASTFCIKLHIDDDELVELSVRVIEKLSCMSDEVFS